MHYNECLPDLGGYWSRPGIVNLLCTFASLDVLHTCIFLMEQYSTEIYLSGAPSRRCKCAVHEQSNCVEDLRHKRSIALCCLTRLFAHDTWRCRRDILIHTQRLAPLRKNIAHELPGVLDPVSRRLVICCRWSPTC